MKTFSYLYKRYKSFLNESSDKGGTTVEDLESDAEENDLIWEEKIRHYLKNDDINLLPEETVLLDEEEEFYGYQEDELIFVEINESGKLVNEEDCVYSTVVLTDLKLTKRDRICLSTCDIDENTGIEGVVELCNEQSDVLLSDIKDYDYRIYKQIQMIANKKIQSE